jgi:hypothetical protein
MSSLRAIEPDLLLGCRRNTTAIGIAGDVKRKSI